MNQWWTVKLTTNSTMDAISCIVQHCFLGPWRVKKSGGSRGAQPPVAGQGGKPTRFLCLIQYFSMDLLVLHEMRYYEIV